MPPYSSNNGGSNGSEEVNMLKLSIGYNNFNGRRKTMVINTIM